MWMAKILNCSPGCCNVKKSRSAKETITSGYSVFSLVVIGLARLWDKRQFVYNLSTNCVHFVLVLSSFCPKFVTTKTTKIFVICQVLDKNKTKVRQMTNCLQTVLFLSCFCTKFDKWQILLLFCCDKF